MLRCAFYAFCKTETGTRATHLNASNQDQLRQMTQNINEHAVLPQSIRTSIFYTNNFKQIRSMFAFPYTFFFECDL